MSNDEGREVPGIPRKRIMKPEELGNTVHEFLEHVKSHEPEGVRAAIILVANLAEPEPGDEERPDGTIPMHVCQYAGGDPDLMASVLCDAIEDMIAQNPAFGEAFSRRMALKALERMKKQLDDSVQADKMTNELWDRLKLKGKPDEKA